MVANTVPESGLLLFLGFNVLWTALKDILWFNVDFGDCYGLDDPLWGSVWRYVVKTISQTDVNCWTSPPTIYQSSPFFLKFKHVVETWQVLIFEGAANLLVLVIILDTIRMWRTISFLRNAWFFIRFPHLFLILFFQKSVAFTSPVSFHTNDSSNE